VGHSLDQIYRNEPEEVATHANRGPLNPLAATRRRFSIASGIQVPTVPPSGYCSTPLDSIGGCRRETWIDALFWPHQR
jgi:hypothetical protein